MGDVADKAGEAEERFRDDALSKALGKYGPAADWTRTSAKWCTAEGCGERIPDERRRAVPGVKLCVACQEDRERRERG